MSADHDGGALSTENRIDLQDLAENDIRLIEDFVELVRQWRAERRQDPTLEFQLLWRRELMRSEETGGDMVVTILLDSADAALGEERPVTGRRRHSYGPRGTRGAT